MSQAVEGVADAGELVSAGKDRRMLRESCMESRSLDEGMPELGNVNAGSRCQRRGTAHGLARPRVQAHLGLLPLA